MLCNGKALHTVSTCVVVVPVHEVHFSSPSTLIVGSSRDSIVREEAWIIPVRSRVAEAVDTEPAGDC